MLLAALGLGALAAGGGAAVLARPPRRRSAGDLALHELAPGVFVYRGFFSNSGVLALSKRCVVVDTQVAPLAAARLREQIAARVQLPITHVVNTHYHGDHVGGNASFPEAEIVASADTARLTVERDGERVEYAHTFGLAFERVHAAPPATRTFEGRLDLDLDGERLELFQPGPVETPDACVVHWPARAAVFTGDAIATHDYPWTGVPFLDEGLQPDGKWVAAIRAIRALRPEVLVPGHGPALVGRRRIDARLDLLATLFTELFAAVRGELAKGTPLADMAARVDARLARFRTRSDLKEQVLSQRFAIYKAMNGLLPGRRGKGWWSELRPSVVRRAPPEAIATQLATMTGAELRARAAIASRPVAIALLEAQAARDPKDAAARGQLADVFLDAGLATRPYVDATEYFAAAAASAREALALDPHDRLGLVSLGGVEVWGAMVLAQPMAPGIAKLTRGLDQLSSPSLTGRQRRKAAFFLGKAHQLEGRLDESDRWYRHALPPPARPLFPLVRARLRATP